GGRLPGAGSVTGDTPVEPDEGFSLMLQSPQNASLPNPQAFATILDDDAVPLASAELSHGASRWGDLAVTPDLFRVQQVPYSSYEAVLDAVTGDAPAAPILERIAADNVTVLRVAQPSVPGGVHRLVWENATPGTVSAQALRVGGSGCSPACGADDVYRIRLYDTTYALTRFNNSATQVTFVLVQNAAGRTVNGHVMFWSPAGALLQARPFTLSDR